MATFRFNPTVLFLVFSLACISRQGASTAAAAGEEAKIQRLAIEHVTPRRDFVGKLPTTLEWTAVEGAESYGVSVENEIELEVFEQVGITKTSMPWPAEIKLDPGTYFWRITAMKDNRIIADSGRAAFVVREP